MAKTRANAATEGKCLSEVVEISRQFLRSVRIDTDIGREDALSGYVCQGTARSLLESMARQVRDTKQRAFTWTGPYGGGKSSLALLLCSLVGSNERLRSQAKGILDLPTEHPINSAFNSHGDGWLVIPVVGRRGRASEEILKCLNGDSEASAGKRRAKIDVIGELVSQADRHPQGVLLIIDELGKFLESAAQEGEDVYFFQELAEAASRAAGKLIVVGILHQAFEAYAVRLGRQARDDWAKVQGRYVDIPLVAATDEVIELVGKAIEVDKGVEKSSADRVSKVVANAIRARRPGTPATVGTSLSSCWPLHPVVAALLGPISRRRFSQNERSTFGFLASREPLGFLEYLDGTAADATASYRPAHYWDYLSTNLEPAILASPDGHKWAQATDAVERAQTKGSPLHIELTKCVGLIEIFRGGSGLVPEIAVLTVSVQGCTETQVFEALKDLVDWKILIERKYLNAYGVFAGSDFDIDGAINQARIELGVPDLSRLSSLTDLQPVLAKRLYHQNGTMRWFNRFLVKLEDAEQPNWKMLRDPGSVGCFVLCLPASGTGSIAARNRAKRLSEIHEYQRSLFGTPSNADKISDLALDLMACERVFKTRPEIDGDSVARKELLNRTSLIRKSLEDELSEAFILSKWYWRGDSPVDPSAGQVTALASLVAERIFDKTPIFKNELINREEPSSNSSRARKDLMYRMAKHWYLPNLGYEGFPADRGLYESLLRTTTLHAIRGGGWCFGPPKTVIPGREALFNFWREAEHLLKNSTDLTSIADLYAVWTAEPYGLKKGILPILAMAIFLSMRTQLALYVDGVFTPELTEANIDEWLHDPKRVSLRFVSATKDLNSFVEAIASSVPSQELVQTDREPLEVARSLVAFYLGLPGWTKRTTTISTRAQAIRAMLLKASDPHKVLFSDLPTMLEAASAEEVAERLKAVNDELSTAYRRVIFGIRENLTRALDHSDGDWERLQERARVVKGIAGEFRLEAFVSRLENFDGSPTKVEEIASLAVSKPATQWVDRDIEAAILQLNTWSHEFRRAEAFAPLRGRPSTRRALGVVFAGGMGREFTASIDIDENEKAAVSELARDLLSKLQGPRREVALAALAEAGTLLLSTSVNKGMA
jgi:hypothetical protein